MKLKLLDVRTDKEFVEFGTCKMCFSTGMVDNPVFIFEKEDGTQFEVDGYWQSWGDYVSAEIGNVIEFSGYLNKLEFDDDTEFDSGWLMNLVDHYNYPE